MKKHILLAGCFFVLSILAIKDIAIKQNKAQLAFNAWKKCNQQNPNNCEHLFNQFMQNQKALFASNKQTTVIERHANTVASLLTN